MLDILINMVPGITLNLLILFFVMKKIGLIDMYINIESLKQNKDLKDLELTQQRIIFERKFYKDKAIQDILELFDSIISRFWIFDEDNNGQIIPPKVEELNQIIKKIILYGGKNTIEIFASFQQLSFSKEKNDEKPYELVYLVCLLVTSLKYDITTEKISPSELLKIKLNDYEEHKDSFEEFKNKYFKYL